MKALYFKEHGELDVIQYGDVPNPTLSPGEVLLRVIRQGNAAYVVIMPDGE